MSAPYQLFPRLDDATERALYESIVRFGVVVPVVVDQHGQIIDGHHRARLAAEIGADCPTEVREVESDEEARELARSLNADRRHLSVEQRREMVAALRQEGHSLRAIASAVGVSKSQVANDIDELSTGGQLDAPDTIDGRGGRSYPARRHEPALTEDEREDLAGLEARIEERGGAEAVEVIADALHAHGMTMGDIGTPEARRVLEALDDGAPDAEPDDDDPEPDPARGGSERGYRHAPPDDPTIKDLWSTPRWLFDRLDAEFGFTLDVCALPQSAKCERFFAPEDDGLAQSWAGETCWMNPPYSAFDDWMGKAHAEVTTHPGTLVVALVTNATETSWFHTFAAPHEVRFLRPRIRFIRPDGERGKSPQFGSVVVVLGRAPACHFIDLREVRNADAA